MEGREERTTHLEGRTIETTKFEHRENILKKKEREERKKPQEPRDCNKRSKFMSPESWKEMRKRTRMKKYSK